MQKRSTDSRYLYWQICVEQNCATICYGSIQGTGNCVTEELRTNEEAMEFAIAKVVERTKKGYEIVDAGMYQLKRRHNDQDASDPANEDQDDRQYQSVNRPKKKQKVSHANQQKSKSQPQSATHSQPSSDFADDQDDSDGSQESDASQENVSDSGDHYAIDDGNTIDMEINEAGVRKFWQICVEENCIVTCTGYVHGIGRFHSREFETAEEAQDYAEDQIELKKQRGYKKVRRAAVYQQARKKQTGKSPSLSQAARSEMQKEFSSQYHKQQASQKKQYQSQVSLVGHRPPMVSGPLGRVDPASRLKGSLFVDGDGTSYDVMLIKRNPSQDNYYIIQLVKLSKKNEYIVYTRWGKIPSVGRCNILDTDDLRDAIELFEEKFEQMTGFDWRKRQHYRVQDECYEWVRKDRRRVVGHTHSDDTDTQDRTGNSLNGNQSEGGNICKSSEERNRLPGLHTLCQRGNVGPNSSDDNRNSFSRHNLRENNTEQNLCESNADPSRSNIVRENLSQEQNLCENNVGPNYSNNSHNLCGNNTEQNFQENHITRDVPDVLYLYQNGHFNNQSNLFSLGENNREENPCENNPDCPHSDEPDVLNLYESNGEYDHRNMFSERNLDENNRDQNMCEKNMIEPDVLNLFESNVEYNQFGDQRNLTSEPNLCENNIEESSPQQDHSGNHGPRGSGTNSDGQDLVSHNHIINSQQLNVDQNHTQLNGSDVFRMDDNQRQQSTIDRSAISQVVDNSSGANNNIHLRASEAESCEKCNIVPDSNQEQHVADNGGHVYTQFVLESDGRIRLDFNI
eukprot:TRINITY_DN9010_c0_g3_i2.p1 TRINITY_DN9010_c0_g3~~TRINITY_DN9010_c0_g3_i2.p1  ORF type:complete len:859 (-),score=66.32 TRINITY_DN9010_c0_g3_i2:166-2550(-)